MKGVLIHGGPTTGKTVLIQELRKRGHIVQDTDEIIQRDFGQKRAQEGHYEKIISGDYMKSFANELRNTLDMGGIVITNMPMVADILRRRFDLRFVRKAQDLYDIWHQRGNSGNEWLKMPEVLMWTENDTFKKYTERYGQPVILPIGKYLTDSLPEIEALCLQGGK